MKSPGSTTITNHSQTMTPRGREKRQKVTHTRLKNRCMRSILTGSLLSKRGDHRAEKKNMRTRNKARLNIKRIVVIYKATQNENNTRTTALERSVGETTRYGVYYRNTSHLVPM